MIRLSENFSLNEFLHSDTGDKLGLVNRVSLIELERLQAGALLLEEIRRLLGDTPIAITSGFRGREINEAVGGVVNSDHALGYAFDFKHRLPVKEVCRIISQSDIMFDQLINEFDRWTHISFNPRFRRNILKAVKVRGRTEYRAGL